MWDVLFMHVPDVFRTPFQVRWHCRHNTMSLSTTSTTGLTSCWNSSSCLNLLHVLKPPCQMHALHASHADCTPGLGHAGVLLVSSGRAQGLSLTMQV